ncbi:MAG: hypothetical protein P4L95_24015 [Rouxiella aceris]|nr:hypothetical protein [Rouxiella aceris]MDR3434932.1 hypothetical protein [Rouxiella aceris]
MATGQDDTPFQYYPQSCPCLWMAAVVAVGVAVVAVGALFDLSHS